MKPPHPFITAALFTALLASCGTNGDNNAANKSSSEPQSLSRRLSEDQGYVQDSEGNWKPRSDRRSQFDSQRNASINPRNTNNFNNRSINPGQYRTTEWTRAQSNTPQSYTGDTDGSRHRSTAQAQGQRHRSTNARANNATGPYATSGYRTNSARETSTRRLDRPDDAATTSRRQNYIEPDVVDWRQQRGLGIEQSRSILGR